MFCQDDNMVNIIIDFNNKIRKLFPNIPSKDLLQILSKKGYQEWLKKIPPDQSDSFLTSYVDKIVKAHIRHNYTNYDKKLFIGEKRDNARLSVSSKIENIMESWR